MPDTIPHPIQTIASETWLNIALTAILITAPLLAWTLGEVYYVNLGSRIAILALAGTGLNIALGQGGLISFGHAAFFGLGGYTAAIAAHHALEGSAIVSWPFEIGATDLMPLIWCAAILVSAAVGAIIAALSLKTAGAYFIMITLAFAQMIYYLAVSIPTYGGEDGLPITLRNRIPGIETTKPLTFFFLCLACLGLGLWIFHTIQQSRFGAALATARMNETRLATAGIEPFPIKLSAFVISAALTGLAGALYADLNGFAGPSMLNWHTSGEIMVFVILGGVGRLYGPVAGAALFILLETFIGGMTDRWAFFLGLILLSVVLFAPGGLIGLFSGKSRAN